MWYNIYIDNTISIGYMSLCSHYRDSQLLLWFINKSECIDRPDHRWSRRQFDVCFQQQKTINKKIEWQLVVNWVKIGLHFPQYMLWCLFWNMKNRYILYRNIYLCCCVLFIYIYIYVCYLLTYEYNHFCSFL